MHPYGFLYIQIYAQLHIRANPHSNQSIKGPHKATHAQGEATSEHYHRGQQTLRHEVPQAWGAKNESRQHLACATHSFSTTYARPAYGEYEVVQG